MASSAFHPTTLRQLLRRLYPHKAMGYARTHFRHLALGPVRLVDAVELLESFAISLVPREAQVLVHYVFGLNTELCQAGPVDKDHPARPQSRAHHSQPFSRKRRPTKH